MTRSRVKTLCVLPSYPGSIDSLRSLEVQARGDHGLYAWANFLERLTKTFFPKNNKTLLDRRRVSKAIQAIRDEFAPLAGKRTVPLRAIRYHLGNVLTVGTTQGRFLTQGVTFCGLRPMRSVSARVVCLIGMNDGAFPRQSRNPSFDLSGDRQPGDRSVREDDRYLFLETLWSARKIPLPELRRAIHPAQPEDSAFGGGKRIARRLGQTDRLPGTRMASPSEPTKN